MDRCALFVDANYALAEGALTVHGTRNRDSVSWDYAGLLKLLGSLSRERSGLPLLRCYWYDTAADGARAVEHEALADIPGLKLRLSKARPSRMDGVGAEIRRDLTALARNHAVSDVIVVSAEEDLAQVVAEIQDLGIRTVLLHIAVDGDWANARALRQECDDIIEIGSGHLRPYVDLISGAEPQLAPASVRELPGAAAHSNAAQSSGPHPAIEAPAVRLYNSPPATGYEHAALASAASGLEQGQRHDQFQHEQRQQDQRQQDQGQQTQAESAHAQRYEQGAVFEQLVRADDGRGQPGSLGQPGSPSSNGAGQNGPRQNGLGQDGLGNTQQGQAQIGQNQFGEAQFGQNQPGQNQLGQNQLGQGQHDLDNFRQSQQGQDHQGQPRHGQDQFGQSYLGQSQPGQSQPGQNGEAGAIGLAGNGAGGQQPGRFGTEGASHQRSAGSQQAGQLANGLPPGATAANGMPANGIPSGQGAPVGGQGNGLQAGYQSHGLPSADLPPNGVPGNGLPANGMPANGMSSGHGGLPASGGGNQSANGQSASARGHSLPGSTPNDGQYQQGGQPPVGPPAHSGQQGSSQLGQHSQGPSLGQPGYGQAGYDQPGVGQPGLDRARLDQDRARLDQVGTGQAAVGLHQRSGGQAGPAQPSTAHPQAALSQAALSQAALSQGALSQAALSQAAPAPRPQPQAAQPPTAQPPTALQPNGMVQPNGLMPTEGQRSPSPHRQQPSGNGVPYAQQDRSMPYGGSQQPAQFSGPAGASRYGPGGPGSYGSQQPAMAPVAMPVGDAVQSAHAEGFGFGEAVARDAPALWLEAVLARKPRMPSDLEARLLQGSALPIDSLLHDEVRHALRRGFWDALERSRH